MDLQTYVALIGAIIGSGVLLDKISSEQFKGKVASNLLSVETRSFTDYVAGTSLSIFEKIFSDRFVSLRFFVRSISLSTIIVILGLLFLYINFPLTFYAATSFFRSYSFLNSYILGVISPILIFLIFDYLCNGQTKYFLSLMKHSNGLAKFTILGYSDLLVTTSLGIISIAISIYAFAFLVFSTEVKELRLTLDFSENLGIATQDQQAAKNTKSNARYFITVKSEYDVAGKKLNNSEKRLLNAHPIDPSTGYTHAYEETEDGGHTIRFKNTRGVTVGALSDHDFIGKRRNVILRGDRIAYEYFCELFSSAPDDTMFRFKILSGWDKVKVEDACLNHHTINLNLSASVNMELLDKAKVFAINAGDFVELSLATLTEGFLRYYYTSATIIYANPTIWTDKIFLADNKDWVQELNYITQTAWGAKLGIFRISEGGGMPWSTFFVATLFTSAFIWIVILFTAIVYPSVWVLEKLEKHYQKIKIPEFPFTIIALIVTFYFTSAVALT